LITEDSQHEEKTDIDDEERNPSHHCITVDLIQLIGTEDFHHVLASDQGCGICECDDSIEVEEEEALLGVVADTVVDPRAVMVHVGYALAAG